MLMPPQTATAPALTTSAAPSRYPFVVPPLAYAYDALEPYIDAATMRLHHDKHHQAYVDKLNEALRDYPDWQGFSVEDLLRQLDRLPAAIRPAVRDQGGGHANHSLFWNLMAPGQAGTGPKGALAAALIDSFGTFAAFQKAFSEAGTKVFGSGWVFLACAPGRGQLEILALPNQDTVLPLGKQVLLGNDVWEHAYYLNHQNRRADYLAAWWSVVNWGYVGQRLADCRAGNAAQ
ncbi:superoxide dismutase [uncultured Hymenobacter sp.]|uniref:superoxide dismutase n=1 Tax=uncultured Hymenobacter sp. TaxID=170016 RepID=UPI0035CA551C